MVDVKDVAWPRRHALVQRAFEIDDDLDAALMHGCPVGNDRRDKKALLVVDRKQFRHEQVGHRSHQAPVESAKYTTISARRRSPVLLIARLTTTILLWLVSAAVAGAQVPDWTEIALPGGRAALLPSLGLSPV